MSQSPERAQVSQKLAERASGSCKDPKKARGSMLEPERFISNFFLLAGVSLSLVLFGSLWLFLTLSFSLASSGSNSRTRALSGSLDRSGSLWLALCLTWIRSLAPSGFSWLCLWHSLASLGLLGSHWLFLALISSQGTFFARQVVAV